MRADVAPDDRWKAELTCGNPAPLWTDVVVYQAGAAAFGVGENITCVPDAATGVGPANHKAALVALHPDGRRLEAHHPLNQLEHGHFQRTQLILGQFAPRFLQRKRKDARGLVGPQASFGSCSM